MDRLHWVPLNFKFCHFLTRERLVHELLGLCDKPEMAERLDYFKLPNCNIFSASFLGIKTLRYE